MIGRIALFLPNLETGGAERAMTTLANGFVGLGLEVDLLLLQASGPFLKQLASAVNVVDLQTSSAYTSLPGLITYLRRARPVAILSALDLTNLAMILAHRLSRSPARLLIRLDNTLSLQKRVGVKKPAERLLMSTLYPLADEIIAVSAAVADDFSQYSGIQRERLQVIYNPILFSGLADLKSALPDHPWLQVEGPPVILGVGRLTQVKNFSLLLEAFRIVRQTRLARLIILGEGEDRPALETFIHQFGLEDDIALPGVRSNPYAFMSRAAVLALTSHHEGLPTVLVEALACGCPVVSVDCPSGPHEILGGGRFGRLTPPGQAQPLAEAILEILQTGGPSLPAEWSKRFEMETIVQQYLDVFGMQ
jgi:glycosyltransferase involved in cell wall biosynthesis